ncbi:MAG TPA: DDE-type integrase/transposase/recombinase [Arsenophonus apicola]|jgi:putative transposase
MAECGIIVDYSPILLVIRLTPIVNKAFRQYKAPLDRWWCVNEAYINIKGQWRYLDRAVATSRMTIDFLLTVKWDSAAAVFFFTRSFVITANPR